VKIKIGCRESRLAVAQAEIAAETIRRRDDSIEVSLVTIKTTGDKILDKTLDAIGGKGLFVKELEKALLDRTVDICVHSFKDMPSEMDDRLIIAAVSEREAPCDALVLPEGQTEIDFSKPIGTSSPRRAIQLKKMFSQADIVPARGNILTRLEKLDAGQCGALVLAYAGLKRLGLERRASRVFTPDEMIPAACQGILAVQGRAGENYDYLLPFHNAEAYTASLAERAFVKTLEGGCSAPTAAFAHMKDGFLEILGLYVAGQGEATEEIREGKLRVRREDAAWGGALLAEKLKAGGKKTGKVILIGAGPYDQGLITVKGLRTLRKADCVLYDRLINPGFLLETRADCEKIDVGKDSGAHKVTQKEINKLLLEKALPGRMVARLKGGDPFVFGRGAEELTLLRENGIPFEVVPGVTSAVAAPAYAGIPVTHREYASSLHIITGHARAGRALDVDYDALARLKGTLVFLMGLENMEAIVQGLLRAGKPGDTPAAIVKDGTMPRQRRAVGTLAQLVELAESNHLSPPAVIVVGDVALLAETYDWFSQNPLARVKVAAACHAASAEKLGELLSDRGCDAVIYPCADVTPLPFSLPDFTRYAYIIFTSKQGARCFLNGLAARKQDVRTLGGIKIAAVGSETEKELQKYGLFADYTPDRFDAAYLAEGLMKIMRPEEKALFPGALEPESALLDILQEKAEHLPVYETRLIPCDASGLSDADYVLFSSASAVRGLAASAGPNGLKGLRAVCMGARTADAAAQQGMEVLTSRESTFESMAERVEEHVKNEFAKTAPA
jgi:uroporphyrinogen III methyltransferase/synthase